MSNSTNLPQQLLSEDRSTTIIALNVFCIILLLVFIVARIVAQSLITNPWKAWDTWFTVIALIFGISIGASQLYTCSLGFGKHTIRVILDDAAPPRNLVTISMHGYIGAILQAVCVFSTKLALLTLYCRVFGMYHHDNFFRYGVIITGVFCLLLGVGEILVMILQCIPPPFFWNRIYLLFPGEHTDGPTEGYCMDQKSHILVPVALDLITEVAIMVLPARVLWNLRLPPRKKFGLMITFGLGIFVFATNIVRLHYYAKIIQGGDDVAWENIDPWIWTTVQMTMAVVCACIPASAPLLKVFSRKQADTSQGYQVSVPLSDRSQPNSKRGAIGTDKISYRTAFGVSYGEGTQGDGESIRNLKASEDDLHFHAGSGVSEVRR